MSSVDPVDTYEAARRLRFQESAYPGHKWVDNNIMMC